MISIILLASLTFAREDFIETKKLVDEKVSCNNLTNEQIEEIGDYLMELMHPGKAHEQMHQMMGGEESETVKLMHINMAKMMYCNNGEGMNNMMNMMSMMSGSGGMMNSGDMMNGNMMSMMGSGMMGGGMMPMTGMNSMMDNNMMNRQTPQTNMMPGMIGNFGYFGYWGFINVLYVVLIIGLIILVSLGIIKLWK